jgi:TonB family protein
MPSLLAWSIFAKFRVARVVTLFLLMILATLSSDGNPRYSGPQVSRVPPEPVAVDQPCTPEAESVVKLMYVEYPDESLVRETQGSVRIEINLDSTGIVTAARGVTGPPNFVYAALAAANKWTKVPIVDGLHDPLTVDVDVGFKIVPAQLSPATFPEVTNPENVVAILERRGCYGKCPVYRLTVHGDGLVEYEGDTYVHSKGKRRARISSADFDRLLAGFRNANYFSLDDEYTELHKSTEIVVTAGGCSKKLSDTHFSTMPTDLAWTSTTLTVGNKTKTVSDYYGGPASLRKLETQIDEMTNSERWVRGGAKTTGSKGTEP